ncbi:MAG TPA: DUF4399 domain-containing protein [Nevskiaceae bacterium]|nr:DUF4399 domain-containing protein [Nevskiaceae bacterium]
MRRAGRFFQTLSLLSALLLAAPAGAVDLKAAAEVKLASGPAPSAAPAGARVYFIEPADGATLSSPFKVVFGLTGMGVAPAGVQNDKTGHHHLLINQPPVDLGQPLPMTEQVLHFGGGQTETTVTLPPGRHTLQLVLGDWKHQPHAAPVASPLITVTVR